MHKLLQQSKIKSIYLLLLFCLVNLCFSFFATRTFLLATNTLDRNGNWLSSKLFLKKFVMGSYQFFTKKQTLSKEKLNLGAWHGFQEVVYGDKVYPSIVSFDFRLSEDSYLLFIFNKTINGFSAIRFSLNPKFKNEYILAENSGKFVDTRDLSINGFKEGVWYRVEVVFNETGRMKIKIGDKIALVDGIDMPLLQSKIGFRGSYSNSYVDNIIIMDVEGNVFKENFRNDKNLIYIFFGVFLVMSVITKVFQICLVRKGNSFERSIYITLSIFLSFCLVIGAIYLYSYFYFSTRYPSLNSFFNNLIQKEETSLQRKENIIKQKAKSSWESADVNSKNVLFLGTSQTWGAGASEEYLTFVARAENMINKENGYLAQNQNKERVLGDFSKDSYNFINAGMYGVKSKDLVDYYRDYWLKLPLEMVVVNLSTNDVNPKEFRKNLQKIIDLSEAKGLKVIFLLEPNSLEISSDSFFHDIMIEVAKENDIDYFDLHEYLKQKNHTGIIWWDFVHPTNYGHQLIAQKVVEIIKDVKLNY